MVITESTVSFESTWDTLVGALDANPNIGIVAVIDHAANAASAGLALEPSRVVVFGNPNLGSPLMQIDQTVGIDLPQKILVWQERDSVYVGYNSVGYLAARHDLGSAPTLETIAGALRNLAGGATGQEVDDSRVRRLNYIARHPGLVTVESHFGAAETFARLLAAIEASPADIAFTVDHAANADRAGLELRPTSLVVFGNPNLGTPLMNASATAGIDLPLKMLVFEDEDGATQVSYSSMRFLVKRHRIHGERELVATIATALEGFVSAATGR
jgi:uncharacterized protein (DUF302 family)